MSCELFVAYFRVGMDQQGRFDLGLGAQYDAVAEYLGGGERKLVGIYTDIDTGQRCDRPELARALDACRQLNATLFIARLNEPARDAGVQHSIIDRTAWGEAKAFGGTPDWTEASLRHRDRTTNRAGEINRKLADQRAAKLLPVIRVIQVSGVNTLQGIADALNARGIHTARSGQWHPTTVRNLLRRDTSDARRGMGDPKYLRRCQLRGHGWQAATCTHFELIHQPKSQRTSWRLRAASACSRLASAAFLAARAISLQTAPRTRAASAAFRSVLA